MNVREMRFIYILNDFIKKIILLADRRFIGIFFPMREKNPCLLLRREYLAVKSGGGIRGTGTTLILTLPFSTFYLRLCFDGKVNYNKCFSVNIFRLWYFSWF